MSALRIAERQITDIVVLLHFIAGEVPDPAVAHRLRVVADELDDAAQALRELWRTGFGDLL